MDDGHHAHCGACGGLDGSDLFRDLARRLCRLASQRLHLLCHDGKAPPHFAGPRCFYGRVQREKATERKPITRIAKPEKEFGRRQERQGTVVSDKGDKTIVVKVDTIKAHPRYKKVVRRSKRFHAHDEQNAAKIGDVVKIVETRPISKTKNWRLAEILEVAK